MIKNKGQGAGEPDYPSLVNTTPASTNIEYNIIIICWERKRRAAADEWVG